MSPGTCDQCGALLHGSRKFCSEFGCTCTPDTDSKGKVAGASGKHQMDLAAKSKRSLRFGKEEHLSPRGGHTSDSSDQGGEAKSALTWSQLVRIEKDGQGQGESDEDDFPPGMFSGLDAGGGTEATSTESAGCATSAGLKGTVSTLFGSPSSSRSKYFNMNWTVMDEDKLYRAKDRF